MLEVKENFSYSSSHKEAERAANLWWFVPAGQTGKEKVEAKKVGVKTGGSTGFAKFYSSLLLFALLLESAASDMLTPISANTGTSLSTSLPDGVENESKYYEFSSGLKAYCFLSVGNTAQGLKLFAKDGTLLASTNTLTGYKMTLQLKDPQKVIYSNYPGIITRYAITGLGPTYTLTSEQSKTTSKFVLASQVESSSVFIYLAGSQDSRINVKIDTTNLNSISTSSLISGMGWTRSLKFADAAGSKFFQCGDFTFHLLIDKTTMGELNRVNNLVGGVTFEGKNALFNNLNMNHYYVGTETSSLYKLDMTNINGGTMSFSSLAPALTISDAQGASMVNFGTYQYLGITDSKSPEMKLIDKGTFTVYKLFNFPDGLNTNYNSAIGYLDETTKVSFARIEDTNKNFQSYYLVFDNCTYRLASQVCNDCLTGYYRNTTAAAGDCILPVDFPAGYGIDSPNIKMTQCLTGCLNCLSDYTVCTQCNKPSGYYLYTGGCLTTTTMPTGKGPDLASGNVVTCSANQCVTCSNDYTICTACNTGSSYYLSGTTCTHVSAIPSGQGANTSSGTVVSCIDPHCTNCQSNYLTCNGCDTANSFYLDGSICITNSEMPTGKGPNTLTGSVVFCQDTNCLNCSIDYQICLECNSPGGWYLYSGGCLTYSGMPTGKGPDNTTGIVVVCESTGCTDCKNDHKVCLACSTGTNYYLNSSVCVLDTNIVAGYGISMPNGTLQQCQDLNCELCKSNYQVCTKCIILSGYVLYNGGCVLPSTLPNGIGADMPVQIAKACSDTNCNNCQNNYAVCTACSTNYYLYNGLCYSASSSPPGLGPNTITNTLVTCSVSYCYNCSSDYQICLSCNNSAGYYFSSGNCLPVSSMPPQTGLNPSGSSSPCQDLNCDQCYFDYTICLKCLQSGSVFYVDDGTCHRIDQIPNGYGYNPTTFGSSSCNDANCIDCKMDYSVCKACDESKGYYLNGASCQLQSSSFTIQLVIDTNPSKLDSVDVSFLIYPITKVSDEDAMRAIFSWLKKRLILTHKFYKDQQYESEADFKYTRGNSGTTLIDSIYFDSESSNYYTSVTVSCDKSQIVRIKDWTFTVIGFEKQFQLNMRQNSLTQARNLGGTVSTMVGSPPSRNSPLLQGSLLLMVFADPSGALIWLSQLVKTYNRLYYININYGVKLSAFLSRIGEPFILNQISDTGNENVYHSKNYRGKLSKKSVPLDFTSTFQIKYPFYLSSWIFRVGNHYLRSKQVNVPKWYLYVLYFAPKVHLIIFNLVFIDFIWIGSRTILHSKDLSILSLWGAGIAFMLIMIDLLLIFEFILNANHWLFYVKDNKKKLKKEESIKFTRKNSISSPSGSPTSQSSTPRYIRFMSPSGYRVSYPKTYFRIENNKLLVHALSFKMKVGEANFKILLCRSNMQFHLMRCIAYQIIICSLQYSPGLAIGLLMLCEGCKLIHSIYCYLKYKYLKNVICLLMEVSQSITLIMFLTICAFIMHKRFDEVIKDFYQDAGIWIVIASCVAEYLLLLTYIGVAAYDFFKNRKSKKGKQPSLYFDFIKYARNGYSNKISAMNRPVKIISTNASPDVHASQPKFKTKLVKGSSKFISQNDFESIRTGSTRIAPLVIAPKFKSGKQVKSRISFLNLSPKKKNKLKHSSITEQYGQSSKCIMDTKRDSEPDFGTVQVTRERVPSQISSVRY